MSYPIVFAYGFRTFFLLAPLWGAIALTLWTLILGGRVSVPALTPAQWHGHEMLFGFTMAAAGGFFLTASTHWCNRPPLAGWRLAALAATWLAGRLAVWFADTLAPWLVAAIDLTYPVALGVYVSSVLLRFGQPRERVLPPVFAAFVVADLLFHAGNMGLLADGASLAYTLFLGAVAFKIAVIAGRIIPTFMEGWAAANTVSARFPRRPWLEWGALVAIAAFTLAALIAPQGELTGMLALLAGALNLARLAQWQGWRAWADPLLLVLHLGYGWVGVGLALHAAAALPATTVLHGLAAGAIGTWALALMSRASLGHTGRALKSPWWMVPAYAAVIVGAVLRLLDGVAAPAALPALYAASAGLWSLGFLIYLAGYARWLVAPRADGKPG